MSLSPSGIGLAAMSIGRRNVLSVVRDWLPFGVLLAVYDSTRGSGRVPRHAHPVAFGRRRRPVDVPRGADRLVAGTAQDGRRPVVGGVHKLCVHVLLHRSLRRRRVHLAPRPRAVAPVRGAAHLDLLPGTDRLRPGSRGSPVGGRQVHLGRSRRRTGLPALHHHTRTGRARQHPRPGGARTRRGGPLHRADLQPRLGRAAHRSGAGRDRGRPGQVQPGRRDPVTARRGHRTARHVHVGPDAERSAGRSSPAMRW